MKGMSVRTLRGVRYAQIGGLLLGIADLAENITIGHLFIAGVAAVLIAFWLVLISAQTWLIGNRKRLDRHREYLDRPRPDYSAIAAMEREIWGEAFEHDRAPQPQGQDRSADGPRPRPVRYPKPMRPLPNFASGKPQGTTPPDVKPEPAKCYCDYCRGRAGVHGAEATALYRAQVEAVMTRHVSLACECEGCGYRMTTARRLCPKCYGQERRSNLRWERPS